MNQKQILASLNKIANELDNEGLYEESNVLTSVMNKIAQTPNKSNTQQFLSPNPYPDDITRPIIDEWFEKYGGMINETYRKFKFYTIGYDKNDPVDRFLGGATNEMQQVIATFKKFEAVLRMLDSNFNITPPMGKHTLIQSFGVFGDRHSLKDVQSEIWQIWNAATRDLGRMRNIPSIKEFLDTLMTVRKELSAFSGKHQMSLRQKP